MKGKRYTTEDKIRILREADGGERTIQAICQVANVLEVTFHRWKKKFGHMDVNEARRLKELERENTELKKMPAASIVLILLAIASVGRAADTKKLLGGRATIKVACITAYRR
jgi:putative transposase